MRKVCHVEKGAGGLRTQKRRGKEGKRGFAAPGNVLWLAGLNGNNFPSVWTNHGLYTCMEADKSAPSLVRREEAKH
jgi:hypothetical protein